MLKRNIINVFVDRQDFGSHFQQDSWANNDVGIMWHLCVVSDQEY